MGCISWKLLKRGVGVLRKGQECKISKWFCAVCLPNPQWLMRRAPKKKKKSEFWSQMHLGSNSPFSCCVTG